MRNNSLLSLVLVVSAALGLNALVGGWHSRGEGEAMREQARPGDIVMLSSTTCVYCDRARSWLAEQQVPHRECFIETDAACLAEFQARGGQGTPTLVVRGQTIVGFDRERVLELLSRPAASPG